MTLADFIEIEPIYNSHFDDFWSSQNLKAELENKSYKCIVAKQNSEIVGFASIWFSVDDAHITNIVVHKAYRHNGIGKLLLEKLTLEVNTKNEIAQDMYLKYGFRNLGIRKKYYDGKEDAYIMTLYFNK